MTARKRFKRRVRARAAKTGEPYSVARRHLEHRPDKEPRVPDSTITNTLHGFALELPDGWREVPPEVIASHWQIAAFDGSDDTGRRSAGVLLTPSRDQPIGEVVAAIRAGYEATGVASLDGRSERFAGRDGYRLEVQPARSRPAIWIVEHIVVDADRTYRLTLQTDDLDRDRTTFAQVAASFRLIGATAPMPEALQRPALTDRARTVLRIAASEAAELHSSPPTTAHLFYALAAEGEGVAAVVLREAGLDLDAARTALAQVSVDTDTSRTPSDDLAALVKDTAPSVARELGHYYIGTEHLLLAVLRTDNPGSSLGGSLGLDFPALRAAVAEHLTAHLNDRITNATET